ncbi:MAG: CPBP family intramembrane metalloprotease [Silicimonas sp.]|nr:CPBP family intramembrane metalloprotease [Silicimonas sp.]
MQDERPILSYFVLTFAISWLFFIPTFLTWTGVQTPIAGAGYNGFTSFFFPFAPLIVALFLLGRSGGWRAAWTLIKSGFDIRMKPLILGTAFVLPVALAWLTVALVSILGIDELPGSMVPSDLGYPAIVWLVPAFLSMMIFGGGQEEFGWRGYAQRPMREQLGFLWGSLLLGAIWGLWHLPLWIIPGDPHIYIPFLVFVIFTMAFSVQILWLFELSGNKLSVPWIMHGVQNTVLVVLPVYRFDADGPQVGLYLYVALNIVVAALIAIFRKRG